jgi:ABC-2 type transport system permease protein
MTPLLILPPLIFGLLSTGVQPAQQFPHWIQPIVRNQPVSQFVTALRALAGDAAPYGGSVTWSVLAPTLAWLCGLTAFLIPMSAIVLSRRTK